MVLSNATSLGSRVITNTGKYFILFAIKSCWCGWWLRIRDRCVVHFVDHYILVLILIVVDSSFHLRQFGSSLDSWKLWIFGCRSAWSYLSLILAWWHSNIHIFNLTELDIYLHRRGRCDSGHLVNFHSHRAINIWIGLSTPLTHFCVFWCSPRISKMVQNVL